MKTIEKKYSVTQNPCKLCNPLGACLALKGIRGAMPLLHGSQGCSTYIRRYIISHFREPIDIASSNFSEDTAIFGGSRNLKASINNIIRQYEPEVIGIPTTCLSETIGDDVDMIINDYKRENKSDENFPAPVFITVSTPSYKGTHMDGFHETVRSAVEQICTPFIQEPKDTARINIFPGMVSPEDMRYLKEIISDFGLEYSMLPDYSETLDGHLWNDYRRIPEGGTPVDRIKEMNTACASIEFGEMLLGRATASEFLEGTSGVKRYNTGLPIGVNETDKFITILSEITGKAIPRKYSDERGRLIDSYADAHKYIFGIKAAVYGEEDLVIGISSFLNEIGITPVLCASGADTAYFRQKIEKIIPDLKNGSKTVVRSDSDFSEIEEMIEQLTPDIIVGHSRGHSIARKTGIPLIRIGFPIHDRIGGQRILHLGYRGAQRLFDSVVNAVLEKKQGGSPVEYSYM